ncbi:MAG: hypothetical protein Q9P01_06000 [Anaerolineae bacterium]|nr:hypothetical protein [Anaerolineae bacterium]MDQ7034388.1 hypothetical protein [Anaerolineae bacterium]
MSFLPRNTQLGYLEIFEVYEVFDKPILFACQNRAGTMYLAIWEDEDDENLTDTWLYVAVSQNRLEQIRGGNIDLKSAFTDSEDEIVYEVIISQNNTSRVNTLTSFELTDDRLPLAGEKLSLQPAIRRKIEVIGILTGMVLSTKHFELETNRQKYKGYIVKDVNLEDWEFMRHATLSQRYKAVIREVITPKIATSDTSTNYTLLSLSDVDASKG